MHTLRIKCTKDELLSLWMDRSIRLRNEIETIDLLYFKDHNRFPVNDRKIKYLMGSLYELTSCIDEFRSWEENK